MTMMRPSADYAYREIPSDRIKPPVVYAVEVKPREGPVERFHVPSLEICFTAEGNNIHVKAHDFQVDRWVLLAVFCDPVYAKLVEINAQIP